MLISAQDVFTAISLPGVILFDYAQLFVLASRIYCFETG